MKIFLILLTISLWTKRSVSICPKSCNCNPDVRGRKQVRCDQGGMRGSLPTEHMDPNTEIITITAPEENENYLTIGPIFQGFQNLREVHITRSNVPAIGKHSFWGVPTITIVNITHNNISQVLDNNFRGLVNVEELYLDYNEIDSMSSATFQFLTELRILSLRGNRLNSLAPRLFLKLGKLRCLDLSYNDLDHLDPKVFKDVQELRTFHCRSCNLSTINPHMYSLLPNLSHLDLGENQFKYLDREAFLDLRKLLTLKLDGNHFPVVMDGTFQSQGKLQMLNLARSQIAKVTSNAFAFLSSLVELDLSYNKLEALDPATMEPFSQSLRYLLVSGNNIRAQEFAFVLQSTPRLRKLGLADIDMKEGIPLGLLSYVSGLKFLNISGNRLNRFPVELLYPVTSISMLDLSRNELNYLDERALSRLAYVPSVYLGDNPWICDLCHIHMIFDDTLNLSWMRTALCWTPERLRNRTIITLSIDELTTCDAVLDVKETAVFSPRTKQFFCIVIFSALVFAVVLSLVIGCAKLCHRRQYSTYFTSGKSIGKHRTKNGHRRKRSSVAVIDDMPKCFELKPLTVVNGKS